jgi:hypothetical protein
LPNSAKTVPNGSKNVPKRFPNIPKSFRAAPKYVGFACVLWGNEVAVGGENVRTGNMYEQAKAIVDGLVTPELHASCHECKAILGRHHADFMENTLPIHRLEDRVGNGIQEVYAAMRLLQPGKEGTFVEEFQKLLSRLNELLPQSRPLEGISDVEEKRIISENFFPEVELFIERIGVAVEALKAEMQRGGKGGRY